MFGKPGRVLRVFFDVARHPIHRGRRVRSMLRWGRLLAASHLSPTRQITIPYVGGTKLHWPKSSTSAMIAARYGLGEYEDMAFCLHFLRSDDLLCDVGANVGVYTVLAAGAVGASVVALEPIPSTFDLLMQNIHLNGIARRVDSRCLGIGRAPSNLHFTAKQGSYNHVVPDAGPDTISVAVERLDDVLAERVPTMLKIDVEGFEAEVIAGSSMILEMPELQAVLIEMYDGHVARFGSSVESIAGALRSAGMRGPYHYDPDSRRLIGGTPADDTSRHINRRYNQIFVRDISRVKERLNASPVYSVNGISV